MNSQIVTMGESGRIVIPSSIRKELGFEEGGEILVRVKDGELNMISRKRALEKFWEEVKKVKKPGVDMVEEFLKFRKKDSGDI